MSSVYMNKRFFFQCVTACFVFLILVALAYGEDTKGLVPCKGPDCNWCSLIQLIQNLINYAIYLGVLIAAIVFAYGGASYMMMGTKYIGDGGEGFEHAKKILMGVIWGLVAILAGWLVVDTLLKALVDDAKFGVWNKIECQTTATTEGGYSLPTNARTGPNQGRYDRGGDYSDF